MLTELLADWVCMKVVDKAVEKGFDSDRLAKLTESERLEFFRGWGMPETMIKDLENGKCPEKDDFHRWLNAMSRCLG